MSSSERSEFEVSSIIKKSLNVANAAVQHIYRHSWGGWSDTSVPDRHSSFLLKV